MTLPPKAMNSCGTAEDGGSKKANGQVGQASRGPIDLQAPGPSKLNLAGKDLSKLPDWQRQILENKYRVRLLVSF